MTQGKLTSREYVDIILSKSGGYELPKSNPYAKGMFHELDAFQYKMTDVVNNPKHYNHSGIEAIQAIKASMSKDEYEGYLKGNVLKYLWRFRYKNGLEDLKKAQWYLNKLVESYNEVNSDED